jgi:4-hydroxy-tetrahydrodipicolinate reductase
LRVVQWGTGYTGESALRYVIDHPRLELVGARCYRPDRVGTDVGDLAGRGHVGVATSADPKELLALAPDCVVFMPRDPHDDPSLPGAASQSWLGELELLLRGGANVVSSLTTPCHWRHLARGREFRDRLRSWCDEGNSTVHFTGFDPGFATDALAYTLSACVGGISGIRIWEIIDVSGYTSMPSLHRLGFGRPPGEFVGVEEDTLRIGWGGALHLLADALGVAVDRLRTTFDCWTAPEAFTTPGGLHVAAGAIAAIRWTLSAEVDDGPRLELRKVTRASADAAPEWPSLGRDGGYRVEIDGDPPLRGDFPMGLPGGTGSTFADAMAMTAARCVNAVESVAAAAPGYATFLDLPPLGGTGRRC